MSERQAVKNKNLKLKLTVVMGCVRSRPSTTHTSAFPAHIKDEHTLYFFLKKLNKKVIYGHHA